MQHAYPGATWQYIATVANTDVWYQHHPDPNQAIVLGIFGLGPDDRDQLTLADVLTIMPRVANTDMTTQTAIIVQAWRGKDISDEWLSLDPYEQDCNYYSDVYKERNGFRPRTFPSHAEIKEYLSHD